MSTKVVVKVLLLFIFMSVADATLHERAEEHRRNERGAETADIAIDVLSKLPPTASAYRTFVDVAVVSFGFVLGATTLIVYHLAIPKKSNVISVV